MDLYKSLCKNLIAIDNELRSKDQVLHKIAAMAATCPLLKNFDAQTLYDKLLEREELHSTGIGHEIALPHCSLEKLEDFVIGLLVVPAGVDFQAIDKKPVKLFVVIFAPKDKRNEHISYLARISQILQSKETVDELINEKNPVALYDIFFKHIAVREESFQQEIENTLFHVFVQIEDKFEDILQIFSELPESHTSVLDANNPGYYLHSVPLFASFWNENETGFNKIIIGVIPKKLANDVLRQVKAVINNLKNKDGILVITNDVTYFMGSLSK
ncbi:MAG TPA: PTS sugar transporter subunit IIA [Candidatus Cloacimonetes bacterium]|nr:PTS sugar transporter subunit IIA [Candidatus Cloacimonadota bacterium]HEX38325.1 PTS sugar transporter subunit IIA [Candidatus Cloacimonadota bacterium]